MRGNRCPACDRRFLDGTGGVGLEHIRATALRLNRNVRHFGRRGAVISRRRRARRCSLAASADDASLFDAYGVEASNAATALAFRNACGADPSHWHHFFDVLCVNVRHAA